MSIVFDELHQRPIRTAEAAPQEACPAHVGPVLSGENSGERVVEAAAAAFALGCSTEAQRLLGETASLSAGSTTTVTAQVLLATFSDRAAVRPQDHTEHAVVASTLVAWGQPLTAFAVLLAADPDATVRRAARSLAKSRPSDCGLAAVVALHEHNFSLALQLLSEVGRQADGAGLRGIQTHIQTLVGELSVQLGYQAAARRPLAEAIELSTQTGQAGWSARALVAEATRRVMCDDPDRHQTVRQAHRMALTATPALYDRTELLEAHALAADCRWTDAYDVVTRLARRDPADIARLLPAGLLSLLADAATHSGHHEEARVLVSRIGAVDHHCECDIELAELLYASALLSDGCTAETSFEAALAMNPYRLPWHRARTSLAYGGWLRRSRRVTESRSHLLEAQRLFEALELPEWARRAQGELRASGMRTEAPCPERPFDLSPQELEIARLVARGLTNRQIGEALHLSPRTIGSHLYRIFPKLDVTSRNQLRELLE